MKKYLPLRVEGWEAHPWRETPISRGVSTLWIRAAGVHLCHADVFGKWPWHLSWLFIPSVDSLPLAISSWSHCARAQQSKYFSIFAIFLEIASSFNFLFIYFSQCVSMPMLLDAKQLPQSLAGQETLPFLTSQSGDWNGVLGLIMAARANCFSPIPHSYPPFIIELHPNKVLCRSCLIWDYPFLGSKCLLGLLGIDWD